MSELFLRCVCNRKIRVRVEHAGKTGKCACGLFVRVPSVEAFVSSAPPMAPPSAMPPGRWSPGNLVEDRYEVRRKLGEGTFGAVWHVWHRHWHIDLAVKELRPDKQATPGRRQNFQRECQAWIDLGMHPHVVTAWYVRELEGTPYLFLEYCDGGSLADWIDQGKTRDPAIALDVAIQLCWGLAHCHARGIVHRDLKPLNVLVTKEGLVKVTDFGAVKFATSSSSEIDSEVIDLRRTIGGTLQGTPAYMPPEQWIQGGTVDERADVYALGVTLFEMLTGDHPFRPPGRASLADWARVHSAARPVRLPVEPALSGFLLRCFEREPGRRPVSALAAAETLVAIYQQIAGKAHPRIQPQEIDLFADARNNQGVSLFDLGQQDAAASAWQSALDREPYHLEATYNLGLLQWRQGRTTDAELLDQLDQGRNLDPGSPLGPLLLAQVHLERGDHRSALALLEPATCPEQAPPTPSPVPSVMKRLGNLFRRSVALARSPSPHAEQVVPVLSDAEIVGVRAHALEHLSRSGEILRTTGQASWFVCWSHDERTLLTRVGTADLCVWDFATGQCRRRLRAHEADLRGLALDRSGRFALSSDKEGQVCLWDLEDGRCLLDLRPQHGACQALAITSDARVLIVALSQEVVLLDSKGDRLGALPSKHLYRLLLTPDETHLLTEHWDRMDLWDLATFQLVRTFRDSTLANSEARFSYDGRWLFTASQLQDCIGVWEVATGTRIRGFRTGAGGAACVHLSGDTTLALSGGERQMHLWDVATGQCLRSFPGRHVRNRLFGLSRDGRVALAGSHLPSDVDVLDVSRVGVRPAPFVLSTVTRGTTERQRLAQLAYREACDRALRARERGDWSEELAQVRLAREQPGFSCHSEATGLWGRLYARHRRTTFRRAWKLRSLTGHSGAIWSVDVSPDGKRLLSGSYQDCSVRSWDLTSGQHLATWPMTGLVTSVCFSPDGSVALVTLTTCVVALEVASGRRLHTWIGHANTPQAGCWTPDGKQVVTASTGTTKGYDDTLMIWDVTTGQLVHSFSGINSHVHDVCLALDGRTLFSAEGAGCRQWDLTTRECSRVLEKGCTDRVAVCQGGRRLVRCGQISRNVDTWDLSTGKRLASFEDVSYTPHDLDLSPDGRHVLVGGSDHRVHLYDAATGRRVQAFLGHRGDVKAVCFSPDSQLAISGDEDGQIAVWFLDWELEAAEQARNKRR